MLTTCAQVKGILFLDYVRMLKAHKASSGAAFLDPTDLALPATDDRRRPPGIRWRRSSGWATRSCASSRAATLVSVQLWGRFSASQLHAANPMLLAAGRSGRDAQSVSRPARDVLRLRRARGAAAPRRRGADRRSATTWACSPKKPPRYQTMGFFEGLLELAGAQGDRPRGFAQRSWDGDSRTRLDLSCGLAVPDAGSLTAIGSAGAPSSSDARFADEEQRAGDEDRACRAMRATSSAARDRARSRPAAS